MEQTHKVLEVKTMTPPSFQLMPFWPDNIEARFCYEEADFYDHGVNNTRAQLLAVVKALPREVSRYVTPNMFASDVPGPHETLKKYILKRVDQSLDNIDLQHGPATDMLLRTRAVIGQRTSSDGLFRQLFVPKLPQQV